MRILRKSWPVVLTLPFLTVVWGARAQQQPDLRQGRDLAANCFQCHGTNGRAVEGMPSIAGEDAASTYGSMLEYKKKDDFQDIMVPIAHAYSDQQLWELSLYLATIPEHPDEGEEGQGERAMRRVPASGAREGGAE